MLMSRRININRRISIIAKKMKIRGYTRSVRQKQKIKIFYKEKHNLVLISMGSI